MNDDEITIKENEDRRRIMREQSDQISKQGAEIERQQTCIEELEHKLVTSELLEAELEEGWKVNRAAAKREKQCAEQAEAARDKLIEALQKYGMHTYRCAIREEHGNKCSCGWDKTQSRLPHEANNSALAPSVEGDEG